MIGIILYYWDFFYVWFFVFELYSILYFKVVNSDKVQHGFAKYAIDANLFRLVYQF